MVWNLMGRWWPTAINFLMFVTMDYSSSVWNWLAVAGFPFLWRLVVGGWVGVRRLDLIGGWSWANGCAGLYCTRCVVLEIVYCIQVAGRMLKRYSDNIELYSILVRKRMISPNPSSLRGAVLFWGGRVE